MNEKPVKKPSIFELPEDRLATTSETGKRIYLYPADVFGKLKQYRDKVYLFLTLIFLALPWIKINGFPAIMINIPKRQFAFFGLAFWADDAPVLVLIFLSWVFLVAVVTANWGRVWCGWACPQTVFVEGFFRRIEKWVEGTAKDRRKLDEGPLSFTKIWKKSLKYTLFLLCCLIITHSLLAYFLGPDMVWKMMHRSPLDHPVAAIGVAILTGILLFDFGWFREQFCTIACPYGRLQSVLLDQHSLFVAYDAKRGEPRQPDPKSTPNGGDCINCYRCVQVCPTGIDIRRGLQLECVMCTACIDACNQVMKTIGKPEGLIRFDSERGLAGLKRRILRPRTFIYGSMLLFLIITLAIILLNREPIKFTLVRDSLPYQQIGSFNGKEMITNHIKLHIYSHKFEEGKLRISAQNSQLNLTLPVSPLTIAPGKNSRGDLFITFPKSLLKNGKKTESATITVQFPDSTWTKKIDLELIGPFL